MKLKRVVIGLTLALAQAMWIPALAHAHRLSQETPAKPNLLFILTDDQRVGTLDMMPNTAGAFGVDFDQFVVTTSNCCPSRSSILTGRYAHSTGVLNTRTGYQAFKATEPASLGPWLQAAGYRTCFAGKYFNGYVRSDGVPPGWDEFSGRLYGDDQGNGRTIFALREYIGPSSTTEASNAVVSYPNDSSPDPYATRVFGAKASACIERSMDPNWNPDHKPFAVFLWTTSPNTGGPESLYADAPLPPWHKPPSFLERDMSDKPVEIRHSGQILNDATKFEKQRASELRQLLTIDDVVGELLQQLDELGLRSNTVGVFSSDNGRFWGEHRLASKSYAYEESVRVPFRLMIPEQPPETIDKLAANIDIAPTIMALAGDAADHGYQGASLLPLVNDPTTAWRSAQLLENFEAVAYDALRTPRWTYVEWPSGHRELYDRTSDPWQLQNIAGSKRRVVARLSRRLKAMKSG